MEIQNITGTGVMPTALNENSRPEPPAENTEQNRPAPEARDESRGNSIDTRA